MAQLETVGRLGHDSTVVEPRRVAVGQPSASRTRLAKLAILAVLVIGFVMANMLPAVRLDDGSTLPLSAVTTELTRGGDGWVTVLAWLTGIVAALCSVVFPRSERFIETIAVSAASLATLILPVFIFRNLDKVAPAAVGLGPGLWGMVGAFLVAAVLPWLSLLVWNRMHPVLGHDWGKWLFLLPAVVWILMLTVFPLAYAISTSRYGFRNGKDYPRHWVRKLSNPVQRCHVCSGLGVRHDVDRAGDYRRRGRGRGCRQRVDCPAGGRSSLGRCLATGLRLDAAARGADSDRLFDADHSRQGCGIHPRYHLFLRDWLGRRGDDPRLRSGVAFQPGDSRTLGAADDHDAADFRDARGDRLSGPNDLLRGRGGR